MMPSDGGPAFPTERLEDNPIPGVRPRKVPVEYPGMSLRDYFAGKALASGTCVGADPSPLAELCYRIADAMLAARKAK